MREDELLGHIFERSRGLAARFPAVVVGPGHDCAVVAMPARALLKVDQLVEGRHFSAGTPIDLIARKAMARPISDLAACGGTPVAGLCAATLPEGYAQADALFDAVARWAERWSCPLVGGDIAMGGTGSALALCVSVLGAPHPTRGPVLREGAQAGDGVYMTGTLGGSFDEATGLGRHLTFEPRLAEAKWLCDTLGGDLHAMMDVSDGLGRDSGRMAAASGVRLRLEAGLIPRSAGVSDWRRAASDGEDYELLFTTGAAVPGKTPTGVAITRVGTVEAGSGCVIVDGGREIDAAEMGWEHGRD